MSVNDVIKFYIAADFLGEKFAWLLGITTPKYQYIIDEYHRLKVEVGEIPFTYYISHFS